MRTFHRSAHPLRELLLLLPLFFICFLALMAMIDAITGNRSDEVGGTIAFLAFLPAVAITVKVGGQRPVRHLLKLPPAQLRDALIITIPVALALLLIGGFPTYTYSLVAILLATPVMALAEEILFRAWFPQVLGGWLRSELLTYLIPVPLFAAIHVPGSLLGWVSYLISGLCYAILAWAGRSIALSAVLHAMFNLTILQAIDLHGAQQSFLVAKCVLLVVVTIAILWFARRTGSVSFGREESVGAHSADTAPSFGRDGAKLPRANSLEHSEP